MRRKTTVTANQVEIEGLLWRARALLRVASAFVEPEKCRALDTTDPGVLRRHALEMAGRGSVPSGIGVALAILDRVDELGAGAPDEGAPSLA